VAPAERLTTDTPRTTVMGNSFVAPADWTISVRGPATLLTAPEGDATIALVDVAAASADAAVDLAWQAVRPARPWALELRTEAPDRDGWSQRTRYTYRTSPNESRGVTALAQAANGAWTVAIVDAADATASRRAAQLSLVLGRLLPRGGARESFAGQRAHALDAGRLAALGAFVESARTVLGVPGVAVGVVQDGKVLLATGYGVREVGKRAKVDADTKFAIASNTKALTTLMLAKLVAEQRMTWETRAASLLPAFKLGDAATTDKVLVKHLICACTGMPRQDMEWLLEFAQLTPAGALAALAGMQPTTKFGALFQYSNPLAAAAGLIGGAVAYPGRELGAAYDEAMRTRVFAPLGMTSTTLDFKVGQAGNAARAHAVDLQGKTVLGLEALNRAVIPVRPAGGAWSMVRDVLRYVQMELAEGKLPTGAQYLPRETLLARRDAQVALGADAVYGMGLMVDRQFGVPVVHHGGDLLGFHSDMMWLPDHGVGAVVLTNGDPGQVIRDLFRRRLLEVLFDGQPRAEAQLAAAAQAIAAERATLRGQLAVPAAAAAASALAARYASAQLGELVVRRRGATLVFDFGEYSSEVASRANPDGTTSFMTIAPGLTGLELVPAERAGKRALVLRDAQHEYVFEEQ
jgi:CubicO group peptidase (beta-lactamase class C family)